MEVLAIFWETCYSEHIIMREDFKYELVWCGRKYEPITCTSMELDATRDTQNNCYLVSLT